MIELWNRLRSQVSDIVAGMSPARRVGAVLVLGVVLIGLIFLGWRAANPPYATLFSRLTAEDAGEIVAVLRDGGVPYRLTDNGTTVMVPDGRVHETRLALAGQGLPRGGVVGFEVFLETALGATDFDRQVRYNMALQGELTRTIREINGVLDARVHIVMPERRLFARDERPATASVFLQLRPGAQLSANQVRGIAHLMARSVEGLEPENITIVDNWGQVLSDLLRPDPTGLVDGVGMATRLELQRAYERELELRAQTMLETVYGLGRAVVRVNAELNFDMEEERQDLFEPVVRNEGIVRSSQIFEEESTGGGPGGGGIVGVDANIPGFVADADTQSTFSRREEILNFEVNRIERVRVQAPGRLQRLSVGVWLDAELEPAEQLRVRELVAAALGINEERGDSVIVDGTPFAVSPVAAVVADVEPRPAWSISWVMVAVGAALLLLLLLVLRRRAAPAAAPMVDVVVDDEEDLIAVGREETEEERARKQLRERAVDLVRENPREAAQLVKVWLTEG